MSLRPRRQSSLYLSVTRDRKRRPKAATADLGPHCAWDDPLRAPPVRSGPAAEHHAPETAILVLCVFDVGLHCWVFGWSLL